LSVCRNESIRLYIALPLGLAHGLAEPREHDVEGDADAGLLTLVARNLMLEPRGEQYQ
jgi:hypothetical protein